MSAIANQSQGYPNAALKQPGDSVAGRIVGFEDYNVTEYADDPKRGVKKGDPKTFPSGDPILGTRIHLETNPGDEDSRVTYWAEKQNALKAIAAAVRESGKKDIEVGGDLALSFTGFDGRAHAFSAKYSPAE